MRKMTDSQKSDKHDSTKSSNDQLNSSFHYDIEQMSNSKPTLSEDYAELGLVDEEGDYSTPAARNYEVDRSQITLQEIIGVGQFGDVHIGTCRVSQKSGLVNRLNQSITSELEELSLSGSENNHDAKSGSIPVAVKTCKADGDLVTAEKFLEEACE